MTTKMLSSYALLGQLAGTLILAVLEQLHDAALIGRKAGNLTDQLADKLDALGRVLHGRHQYASGGG